MAGRGSGVETADLGAEGTGVAMAPGSGVEVAGVLARPGAGVEARARSAISRSEVRLLLGASERATETGGLETLGWEGDGP